MRVEKQRKKIDQICFPDQNVWRKPEEWLVETEGVEWPWKDLFDTSSEFSQENAADQPLQDQRHVLTDISEKPARLSPEVWLHSSVRGEDSTATVPLPSSTDISLETNSEGYCVEEHSVRGWADNYQEVQDDSNGNWIGWGMIFQVPFFIRNFKILLLFS